MSYVMNNLLKDEQICYQTRVHKIIFARPIFLTLIAIAFFIGAAVNKNNSFLWFFLILGAFFVIMLITDGIYSWIAFVTSEFAITNKRVLIKVGFFRHHTVELVLSKVEGIGVDQGIIGRIFNYGSIIVTGTGGTKEPFKNIENPLNFRKEVQLRISG